MYKIPSHVYLLNTFDPEQSIPRPVVSFQPKNEKVIDFDGLFWIKKNGFSPKENSRYYSPRQRQW